MNRDVAIKRAEQWISELEEDAAFSYVEARDDPGAFDEYCERGDYYQSRADILRALLGIIKGGEE